MRRRFILAGLAVVAVAFAAWRVEAGDGKPTVEDRLTSLEAKIANLEAKVAALTPPVAPVAIDAPEANRKGADWLRDVRVTLDLKEVSLRTAIQMIADAAKVNVIVAPGVGREPVSLRVEDRDLTEVLTVLGSQAHFEWTDVGNHVLRITEAAAK